jgi:hypothetical protein
MASPFKRVKKQEHRNGDNRHRREKQRPIHAKWANEALIDEMSPDTHESRSIFRPLGVSCSCSDAVLADVVYGYQVVEGHKCRYKTDEYRLSYASVHAVKLEPAFPDG